MSTIYLFLSVIFLVHIFGFVNSFQPTEAHLNCKQHTSQKIINLLYIYFVVLQGTKKMGTYQMDVLKGEVCTCQSHNNKSGS